MYDMSKSLTTKLQLPTKHIGPRRFANESIEQCRTNAQWNSLAPIGLTRIHFKTTTLTHNFLISGTPSYLSSLQWAITNQLDSFVRPAQICWCNHPPRLNSALLHFTQLYLCIWNGLPADVRSSPSFQTFKNMLKTHYFRQPSLLGHVLIRRHRFVSTGPPGPCHYDLGECFKFSISMIITKHYYKTTRSIYSSNLDGCQWNL